MPLPNAQLLSGVQVLDISNFIAGPGISTIFADHGAHVIKVEHPEKGDYIRNWGHKKDDISLAWKNHSRGKRLLAVDLNRRRGQEIIRRLSEEADILIENYRPGKLESWGLGYDRLSLSNPGLILVRVTGWGQTGPYKNRPGFGTLMEAFSGLAHATGQPDAPPTLPPFPLGDAVTSMVGVWATMMALYHRDLRNGSGQIIDVSIFESMFSLMGPQVLEYDQLGIVPGRRGNRSSRSAPRNLYQTRDGHWIAVTASAKDMCARLFRAMGREDLILDEKFSTLEKRLEHYDDLDGVVSRWMGNRTKKEAMAVLEAFKVPAAPVCDIAQIMEDPHYRARNAFTTLEDKDLGKVQMADIPVKFSRTPGKIRHTGHTAIGHDTRRILSGIGMEKKEIDALMKAKVIK